MAAAQLLAGCGAIGMAERVLRRVLRIALERGEPTSLAAAYSVQASLEERRGNDERAIILLGRAIDLKPADIWWYHCELALLQKHRGDFSSAVSSLSEALRLLEPGVDAAFRARVEAELQDCRQRTASDSGSESAHR
jgi:tetratricopeptide (TPR) repeat protein